MDWVRFGLTCQLWSSIGSEIELTQSSVFDLVRLPNSIELNPQIDWVRMTSISERSIDYAGNYMNLLWTFSTAESRFLKPSIFRSHSNFAEKYCEVPISRTNFRFHGRFELSGSTVAGHGRFSKSMNEPDHRRLVSLVGRALVCCAGGQVCRTVPCRAVPCRAVPCRAVPCRAVPCRANCYANCYANHDWKESGVQLSHNSRFPLQRWAEHFQVDVCGGKPSFNVHRDGAKAKALASQQCGLSSSPAQCHVSVEFVFGSFLVRGFFPGYSSFSPSWKNQHA